MNTNQHILNFFLSKIKLMNGRIYFKNKMFLPDVSQFKFRFIQKFHDDPVAMHPNKKKT